MTGREYLYQYWNAKAEVKRLESEIASIDDLLGNVTVDPTAEHVQTSPDPDQIGKLVAKKSDIEEKLIEEKEKALDLMHEISSTIGKVEDPDERLLLQLRYMKMLPWSKVNKEMRKVQRYYSVEWMMKHHRHALREIEKITKCTDIYSFKRDTL